jgi:CubicO group peptidase (beta-lactamase class C family)
MTALYEQDQFNGSILVSVNGRVIYRNALGEANFESHQKFTPLTGSCIASLSKQFTAMAIMILAEQKKLIYDDPISRFFPEIKNFADSITIRHLLTHTSGIPDVGDLGIDKPGLTGKEVMKSLKKLHSNFRKPGIKYQYSNTGYILLDGIIQKVSGQNSSDFINRNMLVPLKMNNILL